MEAKVDIEKLQILNDRIAQTIEALNQVRLSVHGVQTGMQSPGQAWGGLSHTPYISGLSQPFGSTPSWVGMTGSFGQPFGRQVDPRIGQTFPYAQYDFLPFRQY